MLKYSLFFFSYRSPMDWCNAAPITHLPPNSLFRVHSHSFRMGPPLLPCPFVFADFAENCFLFRRDPQSTACASAEHLRPTASAEKMEQGRGLKLNRSGEYLCFQKIPSGKNGPSTWYTCEKSLNFKNGQLEAWRYFLNPFRWGK